MSVHYFVIHNSEDGDVSVERLTEDELAARLAEDYYGDTEELIGELPDERAAQLWGHQLVIIKGEVIVPQAVSSVTEWKLP